MDETSNESQAALPDADLTKKEPLGESVASKRLMQLSSRLVQVDRRNPTIRMLKQSKERAFDVSRLEAFKPGVTKTTLLKILADKSMSLISNKERPRGAEKDDQKSWRKSDQEKAKQAPKRSKAEFRQAQAWASSSSALTALRRKKNAIYEESGSQDFYMGFPWISGCCSDEEHTFIQAPLLLFPVDLTIDRKGGQTWKLSPAQNEYPIFNSTLVQALERFDGTTLTQEFSDAAEEFADNKEFAATPEAILEWFGKELLKHGVDISTISYPLAPLPQYTSKTVPKETRGFTLSANVVFGLMPLANSALSNDYEALQLLAEDSPETLPTVLSELLAAEATEEASEPLEEGSLSMDTTPEGDTCFVIPSDSSQEEVLLEARRSNCLVVHGPPGTGKSQVIVNLISDALAKNERVLVCCQKRAALDVVFQRLDKYGLSRHCGVVHDASHDRRELYAHIAKAMDSEAAPKKPDDLAKDVDRLAGEIDENTDALKKMASELHRPRRCGLKARRLYARCAGLCPSDLDFSSLAASINDDDLAKLMQRLSAIAEIQGRIASPHPWQERQSFSALTSFDQPKVEASLEAPARAAAAMSRGFEDIEALALSPKDLSQSPDALDLLEAWGDALKTDASLALFDEVQGGSQDIEKIKKALKVAREHLPSLARLPERPRTRLSEEPGQLAYQLEVYLDKKGGFFKFLDGEFREAKKVVLPYLGANGIEASDQGLKDAIADLRSQQKWEGFELDVRDLPEDGGMLELRSASELANLVEIKSAVVEAQEAYDKLESKAPELFHTLKQGVGLSAAYHEIAALRVAVQSVTDWQEACRGLAPWMREAGIEALIAASNDDADQACESVQALDDGLKDFEDLLTLDTELSRLGEEELRAYTLLVAGGVAFEAWPEELRRGVYFAWLEEVEKESPSLRDVSSPTFTRSSEIFVRNIEKRRELNRLHLQNLLFNQATIERFEPGRVTDKRHRAEKPYRELAAQVNKKSRLWSLRRLIATYWWPLREIMPVWLVSPETLSAAFPLERGLFDLVIFDEASQCAVEHGLPATYRGKRIVIAGDEQQLQPSTQFQTKSEFLEEDEDEEAETYVDNEALEADSILRLAKTRFPQRMLTWHYRSKFSELIDFSNHGFYDGRLKTVPHTLADGAEAPIAFIKVENGEWLNRSNTPEAERVIEELYQLLLEHGEAKSLGVITFNTTQRDRILDMIDARSNEDIEFAEIFTKAFNPSSGNLDEALFIKNIENVQGDERDIILFSIGYGPGEDGRVRAQFGSLSQSGGENRLNVAVSRAKEAIIVVSSIEPEELNVSSSKNRGPRLIRQYLEYARAVSRSSEELRQAVLKGINPTMDAQLNNGLHFDSPFEEQVFDALQAQGLKVDSQVGVSGYRLDLAIVDPNEPSRYLLGIECDGATYHSAPSARERDAYRQRFLESRGWVIQRIWSRNWWQNPDREIDAILALVKEHQSAPKPAESPESSESSSTGKEPEIKGWEGEWPPEGTIKAWINERRDGFEYYAIADFGDGLRMDKYGWAKSRIEARYDCEKEQVNWLSDHKLGVNKYVTPENAEDPASDE